MINLVKRNLRDRELNDVLLVSRTALECGQVNELRKEVLRLLEQVFKAESSNFFLTYGSNQKVSFDQVINRGIDDKFLSLFSRYYYKLDPFYRQTFPPHTSVITTEQVIPFKDLIHSEYYNDFLKHQSIHYEMVIYLRSGSRKMGVVALFRPQKAGNFSTEEVAKAELMVPYLTGALEKTIVSEQVTKSEGIIKSITSDLRNKGIIILDEGLEPVYQNEEAIRISSSIGDPDRPWEKPTGGLPKQLHLSCQRLKDSIHLKKPIGLCQQEFSQRISAGEQQVSVRLHLLPSGGKSPLFLIYLELNKPPFLLAQSENKFGLTRREVEIVNLLYLGLKNSEISERLFISEHTVENHLKSIYQKLDVYNRTSLIYRLTHLSWPKPGEGPNGSVYSKS